MSKKDEKHFQRMRDKIIKDTDLKADQSEFLVLEYRSNSKAGWYPLIGEDFTTWPLWGRLIAELALKARKKDAMNGEEFRLTTYARKTIHANRNKKAKAAKKAR